MCLRVFADSCIRNLGVSAGSPASPVSAPVTLYILRQAVRAQAPSRRHTLPAPLPSSQPRGALYPALALSQPPPPWSPVTLCCSQLQNRGPPLPGASVGPQRTRRKRPCKALSGLWLPPTTSVGGPCSAFALLQSASFVHTRTAAIRPLTCLHTLRARVSVCFRTPTEPGRQAVGAQ